MRSSKQTRAAAIFRDGKLSTAGAATEILASGQQRRDDAWAEGSVKPGVTGAVTMLVRLEMCVVSRAQYHTCQTRQRLSNVARSDTGPGSCFVN